jgi:hypothetical protein
VTRKLSRPQIDALRYANGRQLYAADINGGNGSRRRTLLWLLKHGLLGWDPIYHGRVVLTPAGEQQLQQWREKERARVRGTIDDPRSALRIARELAAKEKL